VSTTRNLRAILKEMRAESKRDAKRMHPEDAKSAREGWAEGRKFAPGFCRTRSDWFTALVGVYPDKDAHELLDMLREDFWTEDHS
jgi:hypothetical protein